jgi:integrase
MGAIRHEDKGVAADSEAKEGDRGRTKTIGKSGKGMAKGNSSPLAKTNAKYWEKKVFKPTYVENGDRKQVAHYSARIAYRKQRHTFPLGTGNKEAAGKEAVRIYLFLLANGWEATREEYSPTYAPKSDKPVTVGEYIREAEAAADVSANTLKGYTRAFRRIVSDVAGINPIIKVKRRRRVLDPETGKKHLKEVEETKDVRHDYAADWRKNGGDRESWLAKVDAVKLEAVTPAKIQKWKQAFVKDRSEGSPLKEKTARGTANSYLRKAKSLFSKSILNVTAETLNLPETLPFEGVTLFKKNQLKKLRYESKIDAKELVSAAIEELPKLDEEAFKIFLLGIMAGLRTGEIDSLLWENVDFEKERISVEITDFGGAKSEDSEDWIHADPELIEILRGYRAKAKGEFVIESDRKPRPEREYYYRADRSLHTLYDWLKKKGISDQKPLHTLRKEAGTLIYERFGIYAASRALRHSDIRITTQFYADHKERVSTGLGSLLTGEGEPEGDNVTPIEEGREEAV